MKIAVVRIRGINRVSHKVERTMQQLRLYRKNYCAVVPDTPSFRGMLAKVKDLVAYGPIDDAGYKMLVEKHGEEYKGSGQYVEIDNKKLKPFFRLQPPRGGFERKGIKKVYAVGGALGFRENMMGLIERMI